MRVLLKQKPAGSARCARFNHEREFFNPTQLYGGIIDTHNRSELARHFGVQKTTIDNWIEAGLPGSKNDSGNWEFDPGEVTRWYMGYVTKTSSLASGSLDEAKLRLTAADAALKELKLEIETEQVVPVEHAAEQIAKTLSNVRSRLLSLPNALAPEISVQDDPHQIEILLRNALYAAMLEIVESP